MQSRPRLSPLLALLLPLVLLPGGPAAAAIACPMPDLRDAAGVSDADSIDRSRAALSRYEECLREHAEVLELMDPDAAQRLDLQRDAAAQLKRTLDAWVRARIAAEARRPTS